MHWKDAKETLLKPFIEAQRIGIISDVDGTLSPIVDNPADAYIHQPGKNALITLRGTEPVVLLAFISGRGAKDIHDRVGIEKAVYVGNHGMEQYTGGTLQVNTRVTPYRAKLEKLLADVESIVIEGMEIEDKGPTASVHYRRTANPEQTAADLKPKLTNLASQHGIDLHSGKMVFELRPPVEINKGTAFRDLVKHYKLDAALWMGDDVTDVDAMKMATQLRESNLAYGVSMGVLHDDTPEDVSRYADFVASGVEDVGAFLSWLSSALTAS
ncbi:MAG: trehalose-phosphatase [Chloroflexota bacterium]